MRFFKKTNFDFLAPRKKWYIVSLIITVAGLVGAFTKGVEFGIDFAGGTELQLDFQQNVEIEEIRGALEQGGFRGAEVKYYGADESGVLVRVREGATGTEAESAAVTAKVLETIKTNIQGNSAEMLQQQHIGPKIGAELREKAILAVAFTAIMILIYLGFRFRPIFGVGAVVAMIHDVLVAFGIAVLMNNIFPWLNLEMNSTMLAAFLTLIGFSVNDTVIIFDRVREDLKKYRGDSLYTIMNRAINETMPRTLITTGTVFTTLVVLFIFGGEVLRGFAFTMIIGVIVGTYSSIWVATAVVYDYISNKKGGDAADQRMSAGSRPSVDAPRKEKRVPAAV